MKTQQNEKCVVITSIHPENKALRGFSKQKGYDLVLVGDKKSPATYALKAKYMDISSQEKEFADFSKCMPFNHYCRKNLGYLFAIANGYTHIGESDDDNVPLKNWGMLPKPGSSLTIAGPKFPNMYKLFTRQQVWPRGFPIDRINETEKFRFSKAKSEVFIWQGLADVDPDVDALYRLVLNEPVKFKQNLSFVLEKGVVSSFNSQNTFWFPQAFAFLYLPHTVSFRYTDILRSFVAQFGIWARGGNLGFLSPTVSQADRNVHNQMKDFSDEVEMYKSFYLVVDTLENLKLTGTDQDLLIMYEALYSQGIVRKEELNSVSVWLKTLKKVHNVSK